MASLHIKSRKHGEVSFTCRDEGGYVYVHGLLDGAYMRSRQPCYGGGFSGNTLTANEKTLDKEARKWWRQFLAGQREFAI